MSFRPLVPFVAAFALWFQSLSHSPLAADRISLANLAKATHFHGIAVDPSDSSRLLLATHHGFYSVTMDGQAVLLSDRKDDYMGFTVPAGTTGTLYASGHPATGGNLGVMASTDGGKTWTQIAVGLHGPVDFHQMDVSKADPKVIYGMYGVLQVSRDGGKTWKMAGLEPHGLIDLAASSRSANTLYAATREGLIVSKDSGKTWSPAHPAPIIFTMVEAGFDGSLYAFAVGAGLMRALEGKLEWTVLNNTFGDRVFLHFAADPRSPEKVYAAAQDNTVWASGDGGKTWNRMGG